MSSLRELIEKQIDDPRIWVAPLMLKDAQLYEYIQWEMRKLHAAVEQHLEYCEEAE